MSCTFSRTNPLRLETWLVNPREVTSISCHRIDCFSLFPSLVFLFPSLYGFSSLGSRVLSLYLPSTGDFGSRRVLVVVWSTQKYYLGEDDSTGPLPISGFPFLFNSVGSSWTSSHTSYSFVPENPFGFQDDVPSQFIYDNEDFIDWN